jgi:hypothetical protein
LASNAALFQSLAKTCVGRSAPAAIRPASTVLAVAPLSTVLRVVFIGGIPPREMRQELQA